MSWRLAESLKKLREQINAKHPNRDKSSDGSIGDAGHSSLKSDHNPNPAGVVCAIDIDEDLAPGLTVEGIISSIQASMDRRVKYIIYEGRITVKGDITKWKRYIGPNPHKHHAHISVVGDAKWYDNRDDWAIEGKTSIPLSNNVPTRRDLEIGDRGADVVVLQSKLGIEADGDFGKATKAAVIAVQKRMGLDADGIVGEKTRKILGL